MRQVLHKLVEHGEIETEILQLEVINGRLVQLHDDGRVSDTDAKEFLDALLDELAERGRRAA